MTSQPPEASSRNPKRSVTRVEGGSLRLHRLLCEVAGSMAESELPDGDVASAQQRRVDWLAAAARKHAGDLNGEA
jgi:hypothetical protein